MQNIADFYCSAETTSPPPRLGCTFAAPADLFGEAPSLDLAGADGAAAGGLWAGASALRVSGFGFRV